MRARRRRDRSLPVRAEKLRRDRRPSNVVPRRRAHLRRRLREKADVRAGGEKSSVSAEMSSWKMPSLSAHNEGKVISYIN